MAPTLEEAGVTSIVPAVRALRGIQTERGVGDPTAVEGVIVASDPGVATHEAALEDSAINEQSDLYFFEPFESRRPGMGERLSSFALVHDEEEPGDGIS